MAEAGDFDADLLVIGSGCAALTGALRASSGGMSVVVMEKAELAGGASAMSGGGIWIPANHYARAAGYADSPEEALEYLRATAPPGWHNAEDLLWRRFVATAPSMLEFVEANSALRFALTNEPDPMAEASGGKEIGRMVSPLPLSRRILGPYAKKLRRSTLPHFLTYQEMITLDPYHHPVQVGLRLLPVLAQRLLTNAAGQGNALIVGLLKACLDRGCRLLLATRATRLLVDESGRVVGAEAMRDGKALTLRARRGVLLATGGFEWNAELVARHFGGMFERIGSPRSNEGDGQLMAQAIGARLERMDQANIYPLLPITYQGKPGGLPATFQAEAHAIVVDRHGRRFVSELSYNLGEALDRRDPATGELLHLPAHVITDARYMQHAGMFHRYAAQEKDWIIQAATLDRLAQRIGVPAEALKATVERFNGFCDAGRDDDFHRGEPVWERYKSGHGAKALGKIEEPPFYALSLNRSTVGTKGGARTNDKAQALRADDSVIDGLFCAGNVMANPIGTRAVGAGTTLGPCMTWGFVAAETVLGLL